MDRRRRGGREAGPSALRCLGLLRAPGPAFLSKAAIKIAVDWPSNDLSAIAAVRFVADSIVLDDKPERSSGLPAQPLCRERNYADHPELLGDWVRFWIQARSEEHTSELQSLMRISYAVFCLKKKNK